MNAWGLDEQVLDPTVREVRDYDVIVRGASEILALQEAIARPGTAGTRAAMALLERHAGQGFERVVAIVMAPYLRADVALVRVQCADLVTLIECVTPLLARGGPMNVVNPMAAGPRDGCSDATVLLESLEIAHTHVQRCRAVRAAADERAASPDASSRSDH